MRSDTRHPNRPRRVGRAVLLAARAALVIGLLAGGPWAPVAHAQGADYVIGPTDVLRISVFGQDTLSGPYPVDADGTINFPLVGRVQASGLTQRGVEAELRKKLADGYFTNPQVTAAVETYRSKRILVLGEVRSPGSYPLTGEMSLIEALARAGSTGADAGPEVLIVRGKPGDRTGGPIVDGKVDEAAVAARVDLRQLQEGVLSKNVTLQDGDTIFVPRAESIYVFGQVRSPGAYALKRDTTVVQALALAGGVAPSGTTRRIKIIRLENGKRREMKARLDDLVKAQDTIIVPERYF